MGRHGIKKRFKKQGKKNKLTFNFNVDHIAKEITFNIKHAIYSIIEVKKT